MDLQDAKEIIVTWELDILSYPIKALKQARFENVQLYPSSFSDWISYEENDVVQDVV